MSESEIQAHADTLLHVARASIDHGLVHGTPLAVDRADYPTALQRERGVFVTLVDELDELRGCIGSIEACRSLVEDVTANAFAAAFRDPRFAPLSQAERDGVQCKLSVLTALEPVPYANEADLVSRLQPGVDGLLIEAGPYRATLLPAVWEQLPDPAEFWLALKRKAGLAAHHFPAKMAVYRYRAEAVG